MSETVILKGDICVGCMNSEHHCDRVNITWGGSHGQNIVGCDCFLSDGYKGRTKRDWKDGGFYEIDDRKAPEPPKEATMGRYVSNFD